MRKTLYVLIFASALTFLCGANLFAGEIDILVEKLVEKGVLTHGEAQQIVTETKEEVRKEIAQGKSESLPKWIQSMKLKGDFRLRYQYEDRGDREDRHRGRYRFRLGLESKIADMLKVAAGLATGGNDPRSTNQTFGNTFDTPDIRMDYAYMTWEPTPWATLMGGKIKGVKSTLMTTSDLLWDSDINPEGLSVVLHNSLTDTIDGNLGIGLWVLDEASGDQSDPLILAIQPGIKVKILDDLSLKLACAYYGFNSVKGATLDNSNGTNTLNNGDLAFDYNAVSPNMQIDWIAPFDGFLPYLGVFGDYVYNDDPNAENEGWLAGIKFGDKKVKDWGQWQIKYMYRQLEQDAWLDTFPDSDALDGDTGVEGHEAILTYGLTKNTTLGFDYYYMNGVRNDDRVSLLQIDCLTKF